MTRTRQRGAREAEPLTPKAATGPSRLSDEELAWRLHQELNATVGSPALRTRTRHHGADGHATPSTSRDGTGNDEASTPRAGEEAGPRLTRARAREPEDGEVGPKRVTRGAGRAANGAAPDDGSDSSDEEERDAGRAHRAGPSHPPASPRAAPAPAKREARAVPPQARPPAAAKPVRIPKLPMVLQEDGAWYRTRVVRESSDRVLVEFTGFERRFPSLWLPKTDDRIWRGSYKGKDWRYLGGGAWAPKQGRDPGAALRATGRKRPRQARRTASGADSGEAELDAGDEEREVDERPQGGSRAKEEQSSAGGAQVKEEGAAESGGRRDAQVSAKASEPTQEASCAGRNLPGRAVEDAGSEADGRSPGAPTGRQRGRHNPGRRLLDPIVREALARDAAAALDREAIGGPPLTRRGERQNGPVSKGPRAAQNGAAPSASPPTAAEASAPLRGSRAARKAGGAALAQALSPQTDGRTPTPETPLGRPSRRASLLPTSPPAAMRGWRADAGDAAALESADEADGRRRVKKKASAEPKVVEEPARPAAVEVLPASSSSPRVVAEDRSPAEDDRAAPVAPRRRRKPVICSRAPTGMELDSLARSPTSRARLAREAAALVELERRLEEEDAAAAALEEARARAAAQLREPLGEPAVQAARRVTIESEAPASPRAEGSAGSVAAVDALGAWAASERAPEGVGDSGALEVGKRRNGRLCAGGHSNDDDDDDDDERPGAQRDELSLPRKGHVASTAPDDVWAAYEAEAGACAGGALDGGRNRFASNAPAGRATGRRRGRGGGLRRAAAARRDRAGEGLVLGRGVFNSILGALGAFAGDPASDVAAEPKLGLAGSVGTPGPATPGSSWTLFNGWSETRWHKGGEACVQPRILRVKEELFAAGTAGPFGAQALESAPVPPAPPLPLFQ